MGLFGFGKKKGPQPSPEELGEQYYRWSKTDRSREQAYLELAANQGHSQAMMELGRYYMQHYPRDISKLRQAAELMEKARAAGVTADMRALAELYEQLGDAGRAAQYYLEGANDGDAACQYRTGRNYELGRGVERSDAEAARWYAKAAAMGVIDACTALAQMYQEGRGVQQDPDKACALLEAAGKYGNVKICSDLAWRFFHGEAPCPQDDAKAAHYAGLCLKKKADDQRCRYVHAMLQSEGRGGVAEYYRNACAVLRELIDEGFEPAKSGLEQCKQRRYERTDGLYLRAKEANDRALMDEAARNGCGDADIWFIQEAAARIGRGEKLSEQELLKYMGYYRLSQFQSKGMPHEYLYPLLNQAVAMARTLTLQTEYRRAYDLVQYTYGSEHVPSLALMGTLAGLVEGPYEGIAYLKKALESPHINEPQYETLAPQLKSQYIALRMQQEYEKSGGDRG